MAPAGMCSGAMSPGMTSSSPVENSATLGRLATRKVLSPMLAASPKDAGVERCPCDSTWAPWVTSSPARLIHWPAVGEVRTWMDGMGCSDGSNTTHSSCMTTASAPGGIGAPVKIRAHWPTANRVPTLPAGIRCVTCRTALDVEMSAHRTA